MRTASHKTLGGGGLTAAAAAVAFNAKWCSRFYAFASRFIALHRRQKWRHKLFNHFASQGCSLPRSCRMQQQKQKQQPARLDSLDILQGSLFYALAIISVLQCCRPASCFLLLALRALSHSALCNYVRLMSLFQRLRWRAARNPRRVVYAGLL